MEAAFGAGDGDDEATAVVSKGQASMGQIFEQKYRPWEGEARSQMDEELCDIQTSRVWDFH